MENKISGIFVLKREFGNNVSLLNTNTKALEYMDYFKFKPILEESYGIDKAKIILENVNCYNKVILDFDKNVAKLVKEKDCNFKQTIYSMMTPQAVETEYLNSFDFEDIQGKFQTL